MPEKKEKSTKEVSDPKNKQKNLLVLFAVAVLIGAGAYYFINQKNINTSTPPDVNKVTMAPDNSNSGSNNSSELTSKKWTWVNTKMSDGAVTSPSKDGAFTATFQDDGRLVATTDCNNGNGSYEVGADNTLTIGPMATTMMFCEGSSQDAYFQQLGNVGSYKVNNGQLWLMIKFDSGTMIFE